MEEFIIFGNFHHVFYFPWACKGEQTIEVKQTRINGSSFLVFFTSWIQEIIAEDIYSLTLLGYTHISYL